MTRGAAEARDARIVVEWITGRHTSFQRAMFFARGADTAAAAALNPSDVAFVPARVPVDTAARIISYDGDFDGIGDTLHLAGHTIELQHYAAAGYVEVIGPTVVRFIDSDGWRAFLADADLARTAGVITAPMTDARLRLADAEAFAAPFADAAPRSLHVHADGRVTRGAQGGAVGTVADIDGILARPRPGWVTFAGLVEPHDLMLDLGRRPWLGRYMGAVEMWTLLELTTSDRIEGFGWSVLADTGSALTRSDDPFLVRTSAGFLLADLRTRRRQRLPESTAIVVAALQTSVDPAEAVERVSRSLHVPHAAARSLCVEAMARLGVHPGLPIEGADARAGERA